MKRLVVASILVIIGACGPGPRNGPGDDDDGSGSCAMMTSCSADQQSVVDCNGNVLQMCQPDQGCANGACVDACAAAATNASSIGCDYYAVDPDVVAAGAGGCFAAYIANTSGSPLMINVEYNGMSLPTNDFAYVPSGTGQSITYAPLTNGMLQPNQVAIVFLAETPGGVVACPTGINPALTSGGAVTGTTYGNAFHITTSAPAVAYDIYPYGGGPSAVTSATLLLPTSVWDVNYVAADAYESAGVGEAPTVDIVGSVDGTMVTITPTAAITGGTGVAAGGMGMPTQYSLMAGQVLQFEQTAELAGSVITASAPIGVWGGANCMNVPNSVAYCDAGHQEIPPVKSMGNHYAAIRYRNRFDGKEETVPWRIVGAVDGTTLTYAPSTPTGAPTTLMQGQVAEFDSTGYFTVESQGSDNPFYMAGYMTGCEAESTSDSDCRGDPEYVNIVPPEQYLSKYTFFTDPTYPETNLVLTREKVNGSFADVTIDCAGTVTGWMPIDTADDMEYTRVDLSTGDFQPVGGCNNGLHTASSSQPFGLVVWGWGTAATGGTGLGDPGYTQCVSYAYPAGASVKQINQVVIQ
jgi:hypothetical protein